MDPNSPDFIPNLVTVVILLVILVGFFYLILRKSKSQSQNKNKAKNGPSERLIKMAREGKPEDELLRESFKEHVESNPKLHQFVEVGMISIQLRQPGDTPKQIRERVEEFYKATNRNVEELPWKKDPSGWKDEAA